MALAQAIPELPQPGVQVVQEYTDQTPVIVIPTLVPCVVGVAKEIRELYNSDGTLNTDIIVSGPALAVAPNDQTSYTAMDALTLQLRVNGGVLQTFAMPTGATPPTTMTAQEVAIAINASAPPPVNFAAYVLAEDSNGDGVDDKWYLELRSTSTGEDTFIQIVGGTALIKLGWGEGQTFYGLGAYIQDSVYLKQSSFPDPRSNLEELNIDEDSIRVFVDLGTAPREFLREESFLRLGNYYNVVGPVYGATPVDDGDGDTLTPYIDFKSTGASVPNFQALATYSSLTGTTDLSTFRALHGKELILQIDGSGKQTVKFYGQPIVSTDSTAGGGWDFTSPIGPINSKTLNLLINGVSLVVTFVATTSIADVVTQINAASVATFGVNIAYRCNVAGDPAPAGVFVGLFYGAQPTTNIIPNTELQVAANVSTAHTEIIGDALSHTQLLGKNIGAEPVDDVVEQINNVYPSAVASWVTNFLKLRSLTSGYESKIEIDTNSTAVGAQPPTPASLLGLDITTNGNTFYGNPFPVRSGDAVYGDGAYLGNVSEIHPMATQGRIKLDREVSVSGRWQHWYFLAKNLDTVLSSQWGVTVPTPDIYLDTQGNVHLKHDFLRDIYGQPVSTAKVMLYVAYNAIRLDVTGESADPALLTFNNINELEAAMSPVTPENPLAYGVFCALGNSNGVAVSCSGVSETSADKPYGTLTGFQKAFDFLQSSEVYGIAVLASDLDIAMAAQQHVNLMSEPTMKGERIAVVHIGRPTRKVDTIVASGNDADTITGIPTYLDTGVPNLSQLLLDAGLNPATFGIADGVFLDLSDDIYNWNVIGPVVGGTRLRVNTTFAPGQNDDGFYYDTIGDFPTLISGSFSLKIRGATVASKDEEVETVYARGQGFSDRRVWMMQLDQLKATINGIEQLVPGFYMCAAKVGMVGGQSPAQPFTNLPIAVFTGVTGTNDRYNTTQLNQMAAGGADLTVQETKNGPVWSRMQVTTKMTSVEQREQSIVKAVDYCAKFYRMSLKIYIGRYNITQGFLDTLSTVAQGLGHWLEEEGKVVSGAELNNLIQDENNPDTVLIQVSIDPLYPCNYIVVTLLV